MPATVNKGHKHVLPLFCEVCGLKSTMQGKPFTPESLLRHKFRAHPPGERFAQKPRSMQDGADLSLRQKQILELLSQGKTIKQISRRLNLSFGTVHTHIKRSYLKLGVGNRTSAVLAFLNRGAVEHHGPLAMVHTLTAESTTRDEGIPLGSTGLLKFCPSCGCNLQNIISSVSEFASR